MMRPPSQCYNRVALPNVLEDLPNSEIANVVLPRLSLLNGSVDVEALGRSLGAAARERRVLYLDTSAFASPDELSNLIVTPKGWLCTLEHKSCQFAC